MSSVGVTMPALNWDKFAGLPGSEQANFELLCRGIIRLNFGSFGTFRARANQPGVEFHLRLERHCDALGDPGRWWGWQCKWYDLASGSALGTTRRKQIVDGVRKTETYVPGVTDWILWTRYPLTKSDQDWFNKISTDMTLHLWASEEVDNLMVGQAAVLRGTYFGELVLTPEILSEWHEQSVAPIRLRWQPEVHQSVDAERELRRMLGDIGSWEAIQTLADEIRVGVEGLQWAIGLPGELGTLLRAVTDVASNVVAVLDQIGVAISLGDLDILRETLSTSPVEISGEVRTAPRRLRSARHVSGLHVTNLVAACHEAILLLAEVEDAYSSGVVAVLAPAGCGKTHLAAQLTDGISGRPFGVLFHGRDLHASHTLDDLARRFSIAAQPVPSLESLLAAMNAAGERSRHRLPLVVDGLNEAEDPRVWNSQLAILETKLVNYPYVLVVCTLRPEFESEVLPPDLNRLSIPDYGSDVIEAIRKYFSYYMIHAIDAPIPLGLLKHPLTLRLFCEVTNPKREVVVGIDAMPGSLTTLFDRYLEQAGARIAKLAPLSHRCYDQDVRKAIFEIGGALWDKQARSIDVEELRSLLKDDGRPWDQSMVRALEHEGIVLRMPNDGSGTYVPAYDMLGGHLVANALLSRLGGDRFVAWIRDESTTGALAGKFASRHPLARDIVYSLVGQVPRRLQSRQLWQMVEEPLRSRALRLAAGLDAKYLDTETINALLDLVRQPQQQIPDLLERLREVRGVENHPLNVDALDGVLRSMDVADRDLRWSEWIRLSHKDELVDLERLESRWRRRMSRQGDRLRARWVAWILTSTVRRVRDQATRTLYWFGRLDPEGLFGITLDLLPVNDPYVGERALAASYGVVMSNQYADADFGASLRSFLVQLSAAVVGDSATSPTSHYLSRLYIRGIVAFAKKFYGTEVPDALRGDWRFGAPNAVAPILSVDPRAEEVGQTLHMDFENYTLGGLFEGRTNYEMNHVGHQAACAYVRGVVWDLGWRRDRFGDLDRTIANSAYQSRGERTHVERYGKKYGWIGFFSHAGLLEEHGRLPHDNRRIADVDIDPSFPEPPLVERASDLSQAWLRPEIKSDERWIRDGDIAVPRQLLRRECIGEQEGPWVAVHCNLKAVDRILGREVSCVLSAIVTVKDSTVVLAEGVEDWSPILWISQSVPNDYYTFAGEIPWSPEFAGGHKTPISYCDKVSIGGGNELEIEALAHRYAWENYHSEMNQVDGALVPSRSFSAKFDLRGVPQSFNQMLADGTIATISLGGLDGLDGDILYVKEDLLQAYAGERSIVWFWFGERQLNPYPSSPPDWLVDAQRAEAHIWRTILREADF